MCQVRAQDAPPALFEDAEVATRLCGLDDAEARFAARYFHIRSGIRRDLEKNAGVRSTLVGLTGRVQETRPELQTGGDVLSVADRGSQLLQRLYVSLAAVQIGQDGEIIAIVNATEVRAEPTLQRRVCSGLA